RPGRRSAVRGDEDVERAGPDRSRHGEIGNEQQERHALSVRRQRAPRRRVTHGTGWPRAALLAVIVVAVPVGYVAATHPIDVAIYRDIGRQVLRGDFQLYSANASLGFRYAPIVAFLFAPLAWVPL